MGMSQLVEEFSSRRCLVRMLFLSTFSVWILIHPYYSWSGLPPSFLERMRTYVGGETWAVDSAHESQEAREVRRQEGLSAAWEAMKQPAWDKEYREKPVRRAWSAAWQQARCVTPEIAQMMGLKLRFPEPVILIGPPKEVDGSTQ
jgi:hypothetical protein